MAKVLLNIFSLARLSDVLSFSLFIGLCIKQSENCTLRMCLQMNGGGKGCSLAQRDGRMLLLLRGAAAPGRPGPAASPGGRGGRTGSTQEAPGSDDPAVRFYIETLLKLLPLMCCRSCTFPPRVITPERPEKGNCSLFPVSVESSSAVSVCDEG